MSKTTRLSLKNRVCQQVLPHIRPAPVAALLKRLLNIQRVPVETPAGLLFIDPVSQLGLSLCRFGEYEPEMTQTVQNLLQEGSVFVDLGANEGYFSVVAARRVGPGGRVIAVEPQTRLIPVLEKNCAGNGVRERVEIVNCAVSDQAGTSPFFLAADLNTGSSGLARHTRYPLPTEMVHTTTLADLFGRLGLTRVDLLKVDIEGHEYEAILGSKQLFRDGGIRAVALELHPEWIRGRGLDPQEVPSFLESCGYRRNPNFSNLLYDLPAC
jgi:FkbM family methyltransferase